LARAQIPPPADAYEWVDESGDGDAADAANWHAADDSAPLPTDGAHLNFGTKPAIADGYWEDMGTWDYNEDEDLWEWIPNEVWVPGDYYEGAVSGLGDSPLPARYASLWFGFGAEDDPFDMFTSYTLTGAAITVGYGTEEIDRLIVARGAGRHTFDLDVLIHEVPGLDFRIHNDMPHIYEEVELIFAQTLTSHSGTLIVSGLGHTTINELHGTGELIKEGAGLLRVDAANYLGEITLRGGALIGAISDDSTLTLAGGVYGLADGPSTFERDLGEGAGNVRWLADRSGGFTVLDDAELHITLDGGRTLTWGEEHFVSLGSELLFGSATASGSLYWHNALDLGDSLSRSTRTIRVDLFSDRLSGETLFSLHLGEELIAAAGQKLRFIGNGTVVISADNKDFLGNLEIAGVELVFEDGGHFGKAAHLTVGEGGTLTVSIGAGGASPLSGTAAITLSSGTLRWDDPHPAGITRTLGDIILGGGANRIERTSLANVLRANSLVRTDPRSTLLVELLGNAPSGSSLLDFDDTSALESTAIGGIHPWLVVTGRSAWGNTRSDWGVFDINGHLKPYANYYEGSEETWDAGHNVNVTSGTWPSLSADRTINSLRLDGGMVLEGHTLTIGSGGILVGANSFGSIYDEGNGSSYGAITTAAGRPLYIQAHSELYIYAKITGGMDLVKTGGSSLILSSGNYETGHTNELASIYIHEGELSLDGWARIATTGTIYVGDGGHNAALVLENTWDWEPGDTPILSGKRDVRLRGSHDENTTAKLSLVGNHDLRLNHLSIEGNSILEFRIRGNGGLSKIYSEVFSITPTGRLLVRGWIQKEGSNDGGDNMLGYRFTHILVRKTSPGLDDYLRQVWFEDYGSAKKINWAEDDRYWEIVPGGFTPWGEDCPECPEPSTYGAILVAMGAGLVVWRKRRKRAAANQQQHAE